MSANLKQELELGDNSRYAPFIRYLQQERRGQLPATYSDKGKELYREIVGYQEQTGYSWLPLASGVDWIEYYFHGRCFDPSDKAHEHALALTVQRGWDSVLIPIYDLLNHDNGKKNTDNTSVFGQPSLHVKASEAIPQGGEIFGSYNQCNDCEGIMDIWGTPEILRDFGFVEAYPHRFYMHDRDIAFEVDTMDGKPGRYTVKWLAEEDPNDDQITFMDYQRERLVRMLSSGRLDSFQSKVPEHEFKTLKQYHHALMTALDAVLSEELEFEEDDEEDEEEDEEICTADGVCQAGSAWHRYKDLDEEPESIDEFYRVSYQCDTLAFGTEHYEKIENVMSHYQRIDYYMDPETKDMCFYLDTIFQMCSSYRAHYHEMVVHATARYLPEPPKRVLWVGGGDAMLLHEMLKYPSLELAVGLELDQKVTRGAFKHFGVQPHWDDERVQWWFGDATKSILMLPKSYFGSFDMILVDLSDTVFALSVSKELDVIGALSLLLKPGGVFEMNELVSHRFQVW